MTNQQRVGDLQINQDLAYQRREWTFQRVGWMVMALILLLALAGLLGPGPLSSATAGNEAEGSLWLEYGRFTHLKAPASLLIHLGPNATAYAFLMLIFRISGKRSLSQITTLTRRRHYRNSST